MFRVGMLSPRTHSRAREREALWSHQPNGLTDLLALKIVADTYLFVQGKIRERD